MIGQKGNTYYALTANHVVKDYAVSELLIKLQDGSTIDIASKQTPFRDVDLAVIKFNSNKVIPVAILPFLDESLWEAVESWRSITVIGYSAPTPDAPSMLKVINGTLTKVLNNSLDGYNLMYAANTQVGLSGGGVYGNLHDVFPEFLDSENKDSGFYYVTADAENKATQSQVRQSQASQSQIKAIPNIESLIGFDPAERMNNIQKATANATNPLDLAKRFEQATSSFSSNKPQPIVEPQMPEKVEESSLLPSQEVIFKRCIANKNWNPKFNSNNASHTSAKSGWNAFKGNKMFSRSFTCNYIATLDLNNCRGNGKNHTHKYQTLSKRYPDKDPQSYLLLAIHGRSERRDFSSNDRTGAGLGVFLASPQIADYLKNNSKNLGLRNAFSYAKQVCTSQKSSI